MAWLHIRALTVGSPLPSALDTRPEPSHMTSCRSTFASTPHCPFIQVAKINVWEQERRDQSRLDATGFKPTKQEAIWKEAGKQA